MVLDLDLKKIVFACNEGLENPLDLYVQLKALQTDLEKAIKEVQPLAITEAEKYGQKTFKAFGALIELRNGASQWKYVGSAYDNAKARLKYIEDIAKAGGGVDPETGEVIEKAIKVEGKPTIAICFKND